MVRAAERLPVEIRLFGDVGAQFGGQAGERTARGVVIRPHCGFEMANLAERIATQQCIQHRAGQFLASRSFVNRDLPDEQNVLPGRRLISRNKPINAPAGAFCEYAGRA